MVASTTSTTPATATPPAEPETMDPMVEAGLKKWHEDGEPEAKQLDYIRAQRGADPEKPDVEQDRKDEKAIMDYLTGALNMGSPLSAGGHGETAPDAPASSPSSPSAPAASSPSTPAPGTGTSSFTGTGTSTQPGTGPGSGSTP